MEKEGRVIHIGMEIESRLNQLNMTKAELAKRLGTQKQNIKRILEKPSMDTERLLHISKILDYNFFCLYCDTFPNIETVNVNSKGDYSPAIGGKNISYNSSDDILQDDRIRLFTALVADKDERIKELKERIEELKQN